jgi:NAD(P)-dependent dehydrogenase (short-subunit alcohol dehydrogenase family)
MSTRRLENKVVFLTGVSPNVVGGLAYAFADAGARVFCTDARADYAEACARAIGERGGVAAAATCDVTDEASVSAAVIAAIERFGHIDVLLNGAAISRPAGLLEIEPAEFRLQVSVIIEGAFLTTRAVAREMIARDTRGAIICLGSTEGVQGNPGNIAYGTAKAGLQNFVRAAAMELAPHGIRVNLLTPTATDASDAVERAREWGVSWERSARAIPRPHFSNGAEGIPLGRMPAPDDYGPSAVFLASDDATMVTGTELRVDGGVTSRYWRWNPPPHDKLARSSKPKV